MRKYGWHKDVKDSRDFKMMAPAPTVAFPSHFSLRPQCPGIYDQGDIGSCVWNGLALADEFCQMRQPGGTTYIPSRLYGYYYTRAMEGSVRQDEGCQIRDGAKVYGKRGCCKEDEWAYSENNLFVKPPISCDLSAAQKKALRYEHISQTEMGIKSCLYGTGAIPYGFPVVFGSIIFDSFESPQTLKSGMVQMPKRGERELGGHCEAIIGWGTINGKLLWEVRNSWGASVADAGHFWFPAEYLLNPNLASDFWRFTQVQE